MSGKWELPGVPHKGWSCTWVEDLEAPSAVCEMCEVQEIRYLHYMTHPDYPDELAVGCVCAEHMENDYTAPRERERRLRNAASRRTRWLDLHWRRSRKGNPCLKTRDDFLVTIFPKDGRWSGAVTDQITEQTIFAKRLYLTDNAAKLAAFDAVLALKAKRG